MFAKIVPVATSLSLALCLPGSACYADGHQLASAAQAVGAQAVTQQQIAESARQSAVTIYMIDADGQVYATGSGFFVSAGVVATNYHVIKGGARGAVKFPGRDEFYAITDVLAVDGEHDLALLLVPGTGAPPLALGDGDLQVGDTVYAYGSPRGLEGTFSVGVVSALRSNGDIQITAPISPGSSGGPVLDASGQVVAIAVAYNPGGQNLNFCIPVGQLKALMSAAAARP